MLLLVALTVSVVEPLGSEPASGLGLPVLLSVTVSPTAKSVAAGDTQQFTATGHYSDLSTADLTNTVTWSTSSSSVATVSNASGSHGLATAKGVGVATVTATDPSSLIEGTAALTVTPAVLVAITVSPPTTSMAKGDTQQFTATGHYSDLSTVDLTNTVTWSTSSSSVATISNASGSAGLATATGVGVATITATDPSSLIEGTAALTVTPAVLVAITVSPATASVGKGSNEQFTAKGLYSDLSTADLTNAVTWSTSSSSVATISNASGSAGLATATGVGVATVTATDPSSLIEGTAALTVTPAVLVAITVSPATASMAKRQHLVDPLEHPILGLKLGCLKLGEAGKNLAARMSRPRHAPSLRSCSPKSFTWYSSHFVRATSIFASFPASLFPEPRPPDEDRGARLC